MLAVGTQPTRRDSIDGFDDGIEVQMQKLTLESINQESFTVITVDTTVAVAAVLDTRKPKPVRMDFSKYFISNKGSENVLSSCFDTGLRSNSTSKSTIPATRSKYISPGHFKEIMLPLIQSEADVDKKSKASQVIIIIFIS